jgi:hypothetical protein
MKSRLVSVFALLGILAGVTMFLLSCSSKPSPESAGPNPSPTVTAVPEAKPAAAGKGGWMEGIPEAVPPFTYGAYSSQSAKADMGNQTMYNLYYESVTLENGKEYLSQLREKGFKVDEETANPGELSAGAELRQGKGKIGISFGFQKSGHVDLTINVIKNYQ